MTENNKITFADIYRQNSYHAFEMKTKAEQPKQPYCRYCHRIGHSGKDCRISDSERSISCQFCGLNHSFSTCRARFDKHSNSISHHDMEKRLRTWTLYVWFLIIYVLYICIFYLKSRTFLMTRTVNITLLVQSERFRLVLASEKFCRRYALRL